jgi:hypothetical protein
VKVLYKGHVFEAAMSDTYRLAYVRLAETNLMAVRFYADGSVGFCAGGLAEWRTCGEMVAVLADCASKGYTPAPLFHWMRVLAPSELAALVPVTPRAAVRRQRLESLAAEGQHESVAVGSRQLTDRAADAMRAVDAWADETAARVLDEMELAAAEATAADADGYCTACGGERGGHRIGCPVAREVGDGMGAAV